MKTFLLSPAGKDYIWGGTRLKREYGKGALALEPLAETWECSVHPDGPAKAASGAERGLPLRDVLAAHPEFLGSSPSAADGLHILVKLIDAKQNLSVQVHPDDAYAFREEGGQQGKSEMWYVLDADPGARLVFGLSRSTPEEELRASLERGTVEAYLRWVPVHRGDVFYIPAGTIHAIGGGILLAEVQQNSNLTYRLYDYGRLGKDGQPRPLHVDKALAVADLSGTQEPRQPMRVLRYSPGFAEETLCQCPYFQVSRCVLNSVQAALPALPESFRVLLCLDGEGWLREGGAPGDELLGEGGVTSELGGMPEPGGVSGEGRVPFERGGALPFSKGQTFFIPATARDLSLSGRGEFLLIRG